MVHYGSKYLGYCISYTPVNEKNVGKSPAEEPIDMYVSQKKLKNSSYYMDVSNIDFLYIWYVKKK